MNPKSLSGADLARCFGVDRAMITRWKKAGMPENKGVFSLPECIRWRIDRETSDSDSKGDALNGEKWLAVYRRERARLAKLERKKTQEDLVSKDEAIGWLSQILAETKTAFLGFPRRLAPEVFGKEPRDVEGILDDEIKRILRKLARPVEENEKETTSETPKPSARKTQKCIEPSGKPDGKPVGRKKPGTRRTDKRGTGTVEKRKNPVSRRNHGRPQRSPR